MPNCGLARRTRKHPEGSMGEDEIGIYELAPLRRGDVELAASQEFADPVQFLRAIDDHDIASLAAKPITLEFLFGAYRRRNGSPQDQVNLFTEGTRLLCEEQSESRRTAGLTGALSADQRLVVASRIAACMVFGNRASVFTGSNLGDVSEDSVDVRDLAVGAESLRGNEFPVNENSIREVLEGVW